MFGGRKNDKDKDKNESLSSKVMAPENKSKKSGGGGNVTGFDPEGLERAAKAARELDGSRNSGAAIELIKTQETTKQVRKKKFILKFQILSRKMRGFGKRRKKGERQRFRRIVCSSLFLLVDAFMTVTAKEGL
jgi:hypothetical protein